MSGAGANGAVDVDVWLARPAEIAGSHAEWLLSADERSRCQALRVASRRPEFIATRAVVRTVLSRYGAVRPEAWRFTCNDWGRPRVDVGDDPSCCPVDFNLSNSPELVACAIAHGDVAIGVDVEPLTRAPETLELAPEVFSAKELLALQGLPPTSRSERALRLWTLKESYIKARGMGLALPLTGFSFSFDDAGDAHIEVHEVSGDQRRWWFSAIDVEGHRLALACDKPHRWHLRWLVAVGPVGPAETVDDVGRSRPP